MVIGGHFLLSSRPGWGGAGGQRQLHPQLEEPVSSEVSQRKAGTEIYTGQRVFSAAEPEEIPVRPLSPDRAGKEGRVVIPPLPVPLQPQQQERKVQH